MRILRYGICLLPLLLCLLASPPARAGQAEELLSFADALFAEGDHYRAITEYKRFLHHFGENSEAPRAALGIAQCYLAGERWEQAEQALERVATDYPLSAEARRAAVLGAEVPLQRGRFAEARRRFESLLKETRRPPAAEALRYRIAWTYLEEGRFDKARSALESLPGERPAALAAELAEVAELPRKSPRVAGALSAVLPGAGQLYAGRPRDAGLALALNAAFILATLEAFDNGNEVVGGILLFFEGGWYGGNIFNAITSAHKFNRDVRERTKDKLRERFGPPPLGAEPALKLGMVLRF